MIVFSSARMLSRRVLDGWLNSGMPFSGDQIFWNLLERLNNVFFGFWLK
jgi:hypothetical protein